MRKDVRVLALGSYHQLCHSVPLLQAESIMFTVVQSPRHGLIERTSNGHHYHQATTFTMDDIYQNRISYSHDGSNSLKDRFTFTVSDGTNPFFIMEDGGRQVREGEGMGGRPSVTSRKLPSLRGDLAAVTPLKMRAEYSQLCDAIYFFSGVPAFVCANSPQDLDPSRAERSKAGNMVDEALAPEVTAISLNFCQVVTAAPQRFKVDVLSVDDGTPRVVTNLGLQWLEYVDGKVTACVGLASIVSWAVPGEEDSQENILILQHFIFVLWNRCPSVPRKCLGKVKRCAGMPALQLP